MNISNTIQRYIIQLRLKHNKRLAATGMSSFAYVSCGIEIAGWILIRLAVIFFLSLPFVAAFL